MKLHRLLVCVLLLLVASAASAEVLIVADEIPAMRTLARELKAEENVDSQIISFAHPNKKGEMPDTAGASGTNLPPDLSSYQAVIVYIHGDLAENAENAFIDYATNGGKLVLLHHSISTGKRKNPHWFPFLGVELPEGDLEHGGYKWIENSNVTWSIVNLAPKNFITTNKVVYPEKIPYTSTTTATPHDGLPGFTFHGDEVYLNHLLKGPHTLLLGFKYTDATTGVTYMQDRAGWIKSAGKGWVIYLMPGHHVWDFEDAAYSRIVLNAIIYKP